MTVYDLFHMMFQAFRLVLKYFKKIKNKKSQV